MCLIDILSHYKDKNIVVNTSRGRITKNTPERLKTYKYAKCVSMVCNMKTNTLYIVLEGVC